MDISHRDFCETFTENDNDNICYLNYNAHYKSILINDLNKLFNQTLNKNHIFISGSILDKTNTTIYSEKQALCVSFGNLDYNNYIDKYISSCYVKTFKSKGKTYITIIKKTLLKKLINIVNYIYFSKIGKIPNYLLLRITGKISKSTITNIKPKDNLDKYLKIDLNFNKF